MKTLKKALSIVLGLAIMLSCVAGMQVSVAAEGNSLTVTVGEVSAKAGETVVVPVSISNNTGFRALGLEVTYDQTVLTLTSVERVLGPDFQDQINPGDNVGVNSKDVTAYPYVMQWAYVTDDNVTANGVIANLTFTVKEDAVAGTEAFVKADVEFASDKDKDDVTTTVDAGKVTVAAAGPVEDTSLVFRDAYVTVNETLNAVVRIRKKTIPAAKYAKMEVVIIPTGYSSSYNEQSETPIVTEFAVEDTTSGNYTVSYDNISMYELDLSFTVQMKCYDAEGNYVAYSPIATYKTTDLLKEQYVEGATTEAAQKLNIVVTDMLNMGAAAQTYFASTSAAANSQLKAAVDAGDVMNKGWTGVGSTTVPELRHDGQTIYTGVAEARNTLETAVNISGAPVIAYTIRDRDLVYADKSKLSMTISYTKYYNEAEGGRVVSDTIEGDEWAAISNSTGKKFDYKFTSCAMYDANKEITVVITYDGNEVVRSTYSLENCLYDTLGDNEPLNNALNSVATFSASVRAYFATRGTVDAA